MMPEVMIHMQEYIQETQSKNKKSQQSQNISSFMFYPINESQQSIFKIEKIYHTPQGSVIQLYKELSNEDDIGISEIECNWNHFYLNATNVYVYYLEVTKVKPIKRFTERVMTVGQFRSKIQNVYGIDLSNLEELTGFQKLKTFKQKAAARQSIAPIKQQYRQSQISHEIIQHNQNSQISDLKVNEGSSSQNAFIANNGPSIAQCTYEDLANHSSNLIPSVNILNLGEKKQYFKEEAQKINQNDLEKSIQENFQKIMQASVQKIIREDMEKIVQDDIEKKILEQYQDEIITPKQNNNNKKFPQQQFENFSDYKNEQSNQKEIEKLLIQKKISQKTMESQNDEEQLLNNDFSFFDDSYQSPKVNKQPYECKQENSQVSIAKQVSSDLKIKKSSRLSMMQKSISLGTQNQNDLENQQISQPNLLIYSSSNRKIEEQVFKNKRKQSLTNNIDNLNGNMKIQDEIDNDEKQDDLFQIDEDFNDYQTEVHTQTNKHTIGTKTKTNRYSISEKQQNSQYKKAQTDYLDDFKPNSKDQDQQNNLNNRTLSNLSITNHFEQNENEKSSEDQGSPVDPKTSQILNTQQLLLMPSKRSDNQIQSRPQSKRIVRHSILMTQNVLQCSPFINYVPSFKTQYTEYQMQEIVNSTKDQHDDILKRKTVQQKYYNANHYFRQFNSNIFSKQAISAQNYLYIDPPSNLDQSTSQICTSQRISDIKLSNNDIEDDEADSSEIISDNFQEVLQKDFNNNDKASNTSSRNELNQKKKRVINLIYSPLNLKRIQSMKFISISLLCFLLLTVFLNYLAIKDDIDKCRQDTINISKLLQHK